jgi:hypothetical protein
VSEIEPLAPPGPLSLSGVADASDVQLWHFTVGNPQGTYVVLGYGDGESDWVDNPSDPTLLDHRFGESGNYVVTAHSQNNNQNDVTLAISVDEYVEPPPVEGTLPPIDPLTVPWRPTVDDVAALLRARTKDASGNEIGTFNEETRPTDAEVEQLITNGCAKVASLATWYVPGDAQPEASHLAALVTACEVELSYFPEQVRSDRSGFQQLWAMFQDDRQAYIDLVAALVPPGTVAATTGTFKVASGTVLWAYEYGYIGPGVALSDVVNAGH